MGTRGKSNQPPRLSVAVVNANYKGVVQFKREIEKQVSTYEVVNIPTLQKLKQFMRQRAMGIVICAYHSKKELKEVLELGILIRQLRPKSLFEIILLQMAKDSKTDLLKKSGISSCLTIQATHKLIKKTSKKIHMSLLDEWRTHHLPESSPNDEVSDFTPDGDANLSPDKPSNISILPGLQFEGDCWFCSENPLAKQVLDSWIVNLFGPPPRLGKWTKLKQAPNQTTEVWKFKERDPNLKKYTTDSGNWIFFGKEPTYKGGTWTFTSTAPQLSFYENSSKQFVHHRFLLENKNLIKFCANSQFGMEFFNAMNGESSAATEEGGGDFQAPPANDNGQYVATGDPSAPMNTGSQNVVFSNDDAVQDDLTQKTTFSSGSGVPQSTPNPVTFQDTGVSNASNESNVSFGSDETGAPNAGDYNNAPSEGSTSFADSLANFGSAQPDQSFLDNMGDGPTSEGDSNVSASSQSDMLSSPEQSNVNLVAPIDLESDCWVSFKNPPAKLYNGSWLIPMLGPSPKIGKWVKMKGTSSDLEVYKWKERHVSFVEYIPNFGTWVFFGRKPEYSKGIWTFVSSAPQMSFYDEKIKDFTFNRFIIKEENALDFAQNSVHSDEHYKRIQLDLQGATAPYIGNQTWDTSAGDDDPVFMAQSQIEQEMPPQDEGEPPPTLIGQNPIELFSYDEEIEEEVVENALGFDPEEETDQNGSEPSQNGLGFDPDEEDEESGSEAPVSMELNAEGSESTLNYRDMKNGLKNTADTSNLYATEELVTEEESHDFLFLLLDSDEEFCKDFQTSVLDLKYRCDYRTSPKEFLRSVKPLAPDFLIINIDLGGAQEVGVILLMAIRKVLGNEIPILGITHHMDNEALLEKAKNNGATSIIAKENYFPEFKQFIKDKKDFVISLQKEDEKEVA
ncbi:hypothetical protein OAB57_02235 [Bacteriovoracaceae bacterium]|nr:hypothetical protein [Bacteriovoracaceae bacterium]